MSDDQKSITSLADYIAVINELAASGEERRYIYRGQKNESWGVKSSALRRLQQSGYGHDYSRNMVVLDAEDLEDTLQLRATLTSAQGLEVLDAEDLEDTLQQSGYGHDYSRNYGGMMLFRGYIHQIIDEVQLRYPNTYSESMTPLECMAHLQHHRVATGLIDFTYSPLVALWFACETAGETAGKVFVVNVQPNTIQEVTTKRALGQELKAFFERDGQWHLWQPAIGNPALDSQRLTVQQSVFLFGAPEFGAPEIKRGMIEREIIIPHGCKETLLQELDRVGISEKTLFPDWAGFLERNTAESVYNAELAEEYYTEEIRKAEDQGNE